MKLVYALIGWIALGSSVFANDIRCYVGFEETQTGGETTIEQELQIDSSATEPNFSFHMFNDKLAVACGSDLEEGKASRQHYLLCAYLKPGSVNAEKKLSGNDMKAFEAQGWNAITVARAPGKNLLSTFVSEQKQFIAMCMPK